MKKSSLTLMDGIKEFNESAINTLREVTNFLSEVESCGGCVTGTSIVDRKHPEVMQLFKFKLDNGMKFCLAYFGRYVSIFTEDEYNSLSYVNTQTLNTFEEMCDKVNGCITVG